MKLPENKTIRYILLFLGIGFVVGIMNTAVVTTTNLAEKGKIEILFPFIYEMTGAFSFTLLLPLMLLLYKKYPLARNNFIIRIPLYFLAAVPLGIIHTYLMYVSRQLIFDIAGWGEYDYGIMPYRLIMEYIKMCIGFATVYIIFYSIKSLKEKEKEKLQRSQLEEQLTKARLDALKSQLNPHFLFNTLNMISSTMYDDIQAADKMMANLSELLRESLNNRDEGVHELGKEIKLLNLYLEIMIARFNDKLEIDVNFDKGLLNAYIPIFLLQPFVENSIKHCMDKNGRVTIKVSGEKIGEKLNIYISDNGPGIEKKGTGILQSGVGLSNTLERLKNLYNEEFDFNWENLTSGGLQIKISIPFIKGNDE
ncbi:MAG: histidine kinase [Ignavibacteria bacterium]|jgi:sensor histidine kinase YesM